MKTSDAVYAGVMRAAGSIAMTAALFLFAGAVVGMVLAGERAGTLAAPAVVAAVTLLLFGLCLTWGGRGVEKQDLPSPIARDGGKRATKAPADPAPPR